MVQLLHQSILTLNQKFDKFNDTVTGKISAIERNYVDLNAKIDSIAAAQPARQSRLLDGGAGDTDGTQTFGGDDK